MSGRRPKPSGLLFTRGGRRLGSGAVPLDRLPPPPKHMSADARAAWTDLGKQLVEQGVLTTEDLRALELLACAWGTWRAAQAVLDEEGPVLREVDRYEREHAVKHPAAAVAAESWTRVMRALVELGATPSARGKVERDTPKDKRDVDPWDEVGDVPPAPEPGPAQ